MRPVHGQPLDHAIEVEFEMLDLGCCEVRVAACWGEEEIYMYGHLVNTACLQWKFATFFEVTFAGDEVRFDANPVRVFEQHRVVAGRKMPLFGRVVEHRFFVQFVVAAATAYSSHLGIFVALFSITFS